MATPTTLPAAFTVGEVLTSTAMNNLRGAFRVLQVNSTTLSSTFTTTSTSFTDITGLSVSITPSATSSKILVYATINGSQDQGINDAALQLVRGSTAISIGDAAATMVQASAQFNAFFGSSQSSQSILFLDSPSTVSATTYKVQMINSSAGTSYINRSKLSSAGYYRTVSAITVMEISA